MANRCLICGKRPANGDQFTCHNCQVKIDTERKKRNGANGFWRYVHYRGTIVGFIRDKDGQLKYTLVRRELKYIPKGKLIDLDVYQDGFSRAQVKKMKKVCLQVANKGC